MPGARRISLLLVQPYLVLRCRRLPGGCGILHCQGPFGKPVLPLHGGPSLPAEFVGGQAGQERQATGMSSSIQHERPVQGPIAQFGIKPEILRTLARKGVDGHGDPIVLWDCF